MTTFDQHHARRIQITPEALGGRRRPLPDSPNTARRNAAFRGYADYMSSTPFEEAFTRLLEIASAQMGMG